MEIPLVEREHGARVEGEEGPVVLLQLDIGLGQLCPGDKLARSGVYGLLSDVTSPVGFAFAQEEVALGVERCIRQWIRLQGRVENLDSLDLLVCR
jgi:hypothetical protein